MICIHCSKVIDSDSKFCIHCGKSQDVKQKNYIGGDLIPFENQNKWGYKDRGTREVIIQPKYYSANEFSENRAVVEINGNYAILDENGHEITPFKYEYVFDFSNGFARIKRDNLLAFIDKFGNEITPFKYDKLENFFGDFAKGCIGSYYWLIDKKGKEVTEVGYHEIFDFNDNLAIVKSNSKYGLIDKQGIQILEPDFEKISITKSGDYIIERNKLQGLLSSEGKEILPCGFNHFIKLSDGTYAVKLKNSWKSYSKTGVENPKINEKYKEFIKKKTRKSRRALIFGILIFLIVAVFAYDLTTNDIGIISKIQYAILGEEEMDWRAIKDQPYDHIGNPYWDYLLKYPNGKYYNSVSKLSDEFEWEMANLKPTINSYREYLRLYPYGSYSEDAKFRIDFIMWDKAKSINTVASYEEYIKILPNGKHSTEASDRRLWIRMDSRGDESAYKTYLTRFPDGIFINKAIDILLANSGCIICQGDTHCNRCKGTGVYGREQKFEFDRCPRASRPLHGNNCRTCGGDSRVNERYIWVDKECSLCNGSGKCGLCSGSGFIQISWLNEWYAKKINCDDCDATGYVYVNSSNQQVSENSFGSRIAPCPTCNLLLNKK